jgi:hypothetical protein
MATDKPRSIVTYVHRPKRPPRKKAQAAAITGPAIVTAASKRDRAIQHREEADDGQEVLARDQGVLRPHDAATRRLMTARPVPRRHWRSYGNDPAADRRPSPGRAATGLLVVVPPHRLRALRQGTDDLRDAHAPGRHADPRHPRAHAP